MKQNENNGLSDRAGFTAANRIGAAMESRFEKNPNEKSLGLLYSVTDMARV